VALKLSPPSTSHYLFLRFAAPLQTNKQTKDPTFPSERLALSVLSKHTTVKRKLRLLCLQVIQLTSACDPKPVYTQLPILRHSSNCSGGVRRACGLTAVPVQSINIASACCTQVVGLSNQAVRTAPKGSDVSQSIRTQKYIFESSNHRQSKACT
jgi:hypothetical protein